MEEDEVVREVDVYLSKTLADHLYVFQYPTRPADRPYDGRNVLCTRMKPKQKKVEIDLGINVNSQYYNRSKGEQIALNVDGPGANYVSGETYFSRPMMDKQVLTSSQVAVSSGCYAVGILRQGRLHVTPVTSLLQLRPSFEYLDKSYSRGQMESKEQEEEKVDEPEAVTVKFAGPNAEKAKKAREKSYSFLQQKWEAEPWVQANYHPEGSHRSKLELERLLCANIEGDASNVPLSAESHLRALVPETLLQSQENPHSSELESVCGLKPLPIFERLRAIMISAQVLKFEHIKELLPPENLEKYLQQIAVLVQGCWVVKSDALYGREATSPFTGISSDVLIRARDYILWCFTKSRYVTRSEVLAVIKIPDEDVTALLTQVAKKVYNKGWEFKYLFDQDFVDNHPNVVQRQEMLWDVRYKQLSRDLRLGQIAVGDTSPRRSFPPPPSPKERRHFKYRESFSDDTEESGVESASSDKMDTDYSLAKKARLKRTSGHRTKRFSGGSPNKNGPKHRYTLEVPPTFLPVLQSAEVKSELLNHVQDVLHEKFCLTIRELKETLPDAALGFIQQREDCEILLEETLRELGAQKLKNKWPQNTQPAPLYAFTKFGTPLDRYRNALLDLFTNTARSRPNFLMKKIEDENGEIVSENVCKQIFEEYCIYKSGYYYLKGTISPDT